MIIINYKTHRVGGLFFGTLFIAFTLEYLVGKYSLLTILILFPFYIQSLYIGSLFPDIDYPRSYLGRRFPFISNIINSKFGHRGFTHSLLFIYCLIFTSLLIGIFIKLFHYNIYIDFGIYIITVEIGFILGCASHIFFDMFNPSGVCIFYPSTKKHRLPLAPTIKLNSRCEKDLLNFLSFLTYILFILYIFYILQTIVSQVL